jgi:hypothetical protein
MKKKTKEGRKDDRKQALDWLAQFIAANKDKDSGVDVSYEDHLKVKKAMK